MTRIDFYQIAGDERTFACRLIDQVFHRGHKIYVHTLDIEQATRLDEHLWVFRPDSFIPHCLIGSGASSGTSSDVTSNLAANIDVPIKIGFDTEPEDHQDVLINLSGVIPLFFSRFDRVAEVVPVDQNSRQAARKNYAFYKERGYSLNYHQIG
jgi:DNA polymerase III subunit chi